MYDVIIAGLGPGGSTAARAAAERGLSVLALEKARMPRYKVCGGGLSARLLPHLPADIVAVIESTVHRIRFSFRAGRAFEHQGNGPIAFLVMRDRFDHHLATAAKRAGVEVRENTPVTEIAELGEGVEARTPRGVFRGRVLIAADGAHSLARRRLNPSFAPRRIFALEEEVEAPSHVLRTSFKDTAWVDLGSVHGGYGWAFPKSGILSIGVGAFQSRDYPIRAQFSAYRNGESLFACLPPARVVGHPIPLYQPELKLASSRILLVGDAANLVDPFLGEGIYYAVQSGELAASTAEEMIRRGLPASRYDAAITATFGPELRAADRIARLAYRFPRLWHEAMRGAPEFMDRFFRLLQGRDSYVGVLDGLRNAGPRLALRGVWRGLTRC